MVVTKDFLEFLFIKRFLPATELGLQITTLCAGIIAVSVVSGVCMFVVGASNVD